MLGNTKELILGLILIVSCGSAGKTIAQAKDSLSSKTSIIPIAFYLPETSLGLGLTGISTYRKSVDTSLRPSQVIYSAVYTFKKQLLLFLPYELYFRDNDIRIKGELGYYRYFYNYYGRGPNSKKEDLENYSVNYPRVDFSYAVTQDRVWFYGVGFKFDNYNITQIESGGLLDIERPIGWQGGVKSNAQIMIIRDYRDNINSARKGSYLELNLEQSLPSFLSSFNYRKVNLDYRHYSSLFSTMTLATRILSSHASAATPFFDLNYISSPLRSRGYADRRYMARNIITLQAEVRYPVIKKLSGVAFAAANSIYDGSIQNLSAAAYRFSAGMGLRYSINKKERTKIRLDLATGGKELNIYLTMNEAF